MILSKYNLNKINAPGLQLPGEDIFDLPEKVLQFGTGVLLRGLPDYYIDKANRQGIFNGRVVVVKSTDTGTTTDFDKQDNLYTIYSSGIENGEEKNEAVICSSISRVLTAGTDWLAILEVARSPELQVVISNTTEVGIQLVKEDIRKQPPASFPSKLLAVLYERYKALKGSADSGLVIIPTELILDNGKKLEAIVLELAHLNGLEPAFMDWLENSNSFCNSLVDRIVPGRPDKATSAQLESERGYSDELHIASEWYSLWAIEGDERVASVLSFSQADKGIVITPNIELFRELKLRLLNATHTLSCAVAFLSGFETVKEAMDDASFEKFINQIAYKEILPAIPYDIDYDVAADFAGKVLDRFRNPSIRHEWVAISAQYSTKLKTRVLPLLLNHYKKQQTVPEGMALSFASFLRFMKIDGNYTGNVNNRDYKVTDANAAYFANLWATKDVNNLVTEVLSNKELWDTDITALPGFADAVTTQLNRLVAEDEPVLTIEK
jgi:tagaturonate reductase